MLLREFSIEDKGQLVDILNNTDVIKYLSSKIPQPYTDDDAHWWVSTGSQSGIVRAIEVNGQLVGCIGVNRGDFEYNRAGEIGYWLAHDYWGKGITTIAIERIVNEVFLSTNIVRIFASVFDENIGSMKVLKNNGFVLEGVHTKAIFKENKFYDNHVFAKLKSHNRSV